MARSSQHAPGTPVLVIGGGGPSVSFYSIAIALALGASSVTYADYDEARLAKAEGLGASIVPSLDAIPSRNYPVTVCSVASRPALTSALKATEPDGTCVCNAIFFEGAVALPMLDMYVRGVRLVTGRVNARAVIPLALNLVTRQMLDPAPITDLVVEWDDAPAALTGRPQNSSSIDDLHAARSRATTATKEPIARPHAPGQDAAVVAERHRKHAVAVGDRGSGLAALKAGRLGGSLVKGWIDEHAVSSTR